LARVSAVLLVGATPFLLHLIERIIERVLIRARSWIRDMLRGDWPWSNDKTATLPGTYA